jgi:glycerol-3-phosphate dehydrogenase
MKRPQPALYENRRFDLVVIGGGINGAAIARDAALRGLSVLLLERHDFASGTTSWSTRLIHGGLRYLEHREFGLVRESLRERERLLKNAPHLVEPLPLYLPIYNWSKRGPLMIRAGMTLYDLLSFDKSLPRHAMLSGDETLAALPGLEADGLKGAARYYDAQATFPERLVLENLIDATANDALAMNYARVDSIISDGFVTRGVVFTDTRDGARHEIQARAVINVAGPWVDEVLDRNRGSGERPLMGGTKGTHCFVSLPSGMDIAPIYCEAKSDGRAIFLVPWNGLLMIGTTDTRYSGDPDDAVATREEIDYLITEARTLLPGAGFTAEDVLFTYSGIRPLPNTEGGAEAGITRRHFVVDHAPTRSGLFSIVGGKLTTHRSLAEDAVDEVANYLGAKGRCTTAGRALPGAAGLMVSDDRVTPDTLARLNAIYGSRARDVIGHASGDPALLRQLTPDCPVIGAELIFAYDVEMATSLADVLLRRAMIGYAPDMGLVAAEALLAAGKDHLGWSADEAAAELESYTSAIERFQPRVLGAG